MLLKSETNSCFSVFCQLIALFSDLETKKTSSNREEAKKGSGEYIMKERVKKIKLKDKKYQEKNSRINDVEYARSKIVPQ